MLITREDRMLITV